jgi:REP element-mobilizing transposase RayT
MPSGMPDHIHILFGFRPTQSLSDLMQNIKRDSSEWINKEKLVMGNFLGKKVMALFHTANRKLLE